MNIYKHTGPGHYVGSCVIVRANSQEEAEQIIRAQLDFSGLADEPLNVHLVNWEVQVIHFDDGDY